MADLPTPETDGVEFPPPDLTDLFAAEDSPMLGGVILRVVAFAAVVGLVAWLVRRRRDRV